MYDNISNEERKRLSRLRQKAVRDAWKDERALVLYGFGTRKWTKNEQKELIETRRVKGYEGHHMKSVSLFPEYAGESWNIQFLTEEEHFEGAHDGDYHNLTNGYYNPETKRMEKLGNRKKLPRIVLTSSTYLQGRNSECGQASLNEIKGDRIVNKGGKMCNANTNGKVFLSALVNTKKGIDDYISIMEKYIKDLETASKVMGSAMGGDEISKKQIGKMKQTIVSLKECVKFARKSSTEIDEKIRIVKLIRDA